MGSWSFFIESIAIKTIRYPYEVEDVDDEKAAGKYSKREVFYSLDEVDRDDWVADMTWIAYRLSGHRRKFMAKLARLLMSTSQHQCLLQIDHKPAKKLLCLLAEELILSADHENKTLAVSIPEGLLDL